MTSKTTARVTCKELYRITKILFILSKTVSLVYINYNI